MKKTLLCRSVLANDKLTAWGRRCALRFPQSIAFSSNGFHRGLSSDASSSSTTKHSTPWERAAVRCKHQAMAQQQATQEAYIAKIRDMVHDSPAMHIKTLQDELQSAIGQALGKQGQKVVNAIATVLQIRMEYDAEVERMRAPHGKTAADSSDDHTRNLASLVERYESARRTAIQARWELLVHRQAAGMTVNNHNVVMETFPIPGPIQSVNWERAK